MRISERAYQLRKTLFPELSGNAAQVAEDQIKSALDEVRKDVLASARDRLKGMTDFEIGRMIDEEPQ